MDTSDSEKEKFSHLKDSIKEKIHADLTQIESKTGKPIPSKAVKLFDDGVDQITPTTKEEFLEFVRKSPDLITVYLETFKKESGGIDPDCQVFIDKMVLDLFKVTKGKGIENRIWTHFSKIWYYGQVIEQMSQKEPSEKTLEADMFQLSSLFLSFYELTLQILTEFSLAIAIKTKPIDRRSQQFLNIYSKEKGKGRSITKQDLVNFMIGEHYLTRDSCNILKHEKIRNKLAHGDAVFDSDTKKFLIGDEVFEIEDLRHLFTELSQFYCYLLYVYLKQPSLLSFIEQLKEIAKKPPDTT